MLMPLRLCFVPGFVSGFVSGFVPGSPARLLQTSGLVLLGCLALGSSALPVFSQVSPAAAQSASVDRPTLRIGSQGEAVNELQAMLKLLGYYREAVNGSYGRTTADAVSAFQRSIGLTADGVTGPETWNRLLPPSPPVSTASTSPAPAPTPVPAPAPTPVPAPTRPAPAPPGSPPSGTNAAANSNETPIDLPTLRVGMRGTAIERLQERLRSLGFYDGEVDGIFGAQTQAAVEAAQRNFGLDPDGVVGPATWRALLQ